MAVMRILSLCMLLCCSEAMFKRDMRTVMEDEFPDLQSWGDAVSKATDKVKGIVHKGQEAVEDIKDLALDTFEAAAAKVNDSLKVVGQEVRDMNTTAMKEIINLDEKVKLAKNKAAVFAAGTSDALEKVKPILQQFLDQLKSVSQMASDVLTQLHQENAAEALNKALAKAMVTATDWAASMQYLDYQLQQMNHSLTSHPEGHVSGRERREERREERRDNRRGAGNATNETEPSPEFEDMAPVLLQSNVDPMEELSKTLKEPMHQLKSAAEKLTAVATEVTGAMGDFVDGTIEAAQKKLPKALMGNVTEVLKGVQAEATQQLQPLGDVGKGIVNGIYQAGSDAGLDLGSFGFRSAKLPFTLLIGFAMAVSGQCL